MNKAALAGRLPLLFYYHRLNRYSFNALGGALDADPELAEVPAALARTPEELLTAAADILSRNDRVIVAFSVLTSQAEEIRSVLRRLRARHKARVVALAGGPHVIANPRAMLGAGMDIVFRGEAEHAFPLALKRIAEGGDPGDLPGLGCRREEELVVNARAVPVDIDAFASISPKRHMIGPIEITRGCPFACSFCQTSHIFGVQPRHRSIDNIVRQAAVIRSKHRKVVRLLSPNAFSYGSPDGRQLNLPAVRELLHSVRRIVGPEGRIVFGYFPSEVRPEHVLPETLELLRTFADNDEIVIGAQSGSARMLKACHRSHTVEDVLTAVARARKSGLKVIVDFILGLPGEAEQDLRDTLDVMAALIRLGARIHPHTFTPLPQTGFAKSAAGAIAPEIARALELLKHRGAVYGDCVGQPEPAGQRCPTCGL